jgi:hypothetical protein
MTTLTLPRVRGAAERAFYTGMALAILAAVFQGFARSFFLRAWYPEPRGAPETFFQLHGAVFTAWFVLLVVQASLVGMGHTDLHRRLGTAGALLAVAMVVMGTEGALIAARRPGGFVGIGVPPLRFLAIPLFDMALFGLSGTSRPAAGCTRPRRGPAWRSWPRSRSACGCPAPRGGWPSRGGRPVSGGDVPGTWHRTEWILDGALQVPGSRPTCRNSRRPGTGTRSRDRPRSRRFDPRTPGRLRRTRRGVRRRHPRARIQVCRGHRRRGEGLARGGEAVVAGAPRPAGVRAGSAPPPAGRRPAPAARG